jgi:hypothetical protein
MTASYGKPQDISLNRGETTAHNGATWHIACSADPVANRRIIGSFAICAMLALFPLEVSAEGASGETASLWRDEWPQFSALEGFLTSGAVLGMVIFSVADPQHEPRWVGGNGFDDGPRKALRLPTKSGRTTAGHVSDVNYYTFPLIPVVIDSFIVSLLVRGDEKASLNLFLVTGEALAYSGLLSYVSNLVGRERPAVTACIAANGGDESGCDLSSRADSFYSGHTAMAAASAGATCAHHTFMPLWGHPLADASACFLGSGAMVATGVGRLMADRHYLSDVLVGSAVGFGVGYMVPTLLHYHVPIASKLTISPAGANGSTGLTVMGQF